MNVRGMGYRLDALPAAPERMETDGAAADNLSVRHVEVDASQFRSHPDEIAHLTGQDAAGRGDDAVRLALEAVRAMREEVGSGAPIDPDRLHRLLLDLK